MKTVSTLLTIALLFAACKKDPIIIQGGTYRLKNPDMGWGVKDTVYAYRLYFNVAAGLEYCECLGPSKGTPTMVAGAKVDSLNGQPDWKIPTDDLK